MGNARASGGHAAGQGTGKALGLLFEGFNFIMDKRKEAHADDLVNRLEEQFRQSTLPESVPSIPSQKGSVVAEPDPLEAALMSIREEEGEVDPLGLGTPGTETFPDLQKATSTEGKVSPVDLLAQLEQIHAVHAQERNTIDSTFSQSLIDADKIYSVVDEPEMNQRLVEHLHRAGRNAALYSQAKMVSDRMNLSGAETTPEMIMRLGPAQVDDMSARVNALPPEDPLEIITEWGRTETGEPGSRKSLANAKTGEIIGPVGTPEFIESASTQRVIDVNATPRAKERALVSDRMDNFVVFAQTADRVIEAITPQTVTGGMVTLAGEVAGSIRTMTSMFFNNTDPDSLQIDPDDPFDPENVAPEVFMGLDALNPETRSIVAGNAQLRSMYAHMAILYFRSHHPQAKSMSQQNLKNNLKALGGDLTDPNMMKNVLRTLVQNQALILNQASRNVDLGPYDPVYKPGVHYKMLSTEGPTTDPNSTWYMRPDMVRRLMGSSHDKVGLTLDEFTGTPQVERAIDITMGLYHDITTKLLLTADDVLGRVHEQYPGMTLEELQLVDPAILKDKFSLGIGEPSGDPLVPAPSVPTIQLSPAMIEQLRSGGLLPDGVIIQDARDR